MILSMRIIGGILAFFGGWCLIIMFFWLREMPFFHPLLILNLLCAGLSLIGGILLFKGKALGGVLALIGGDLFFIFGFLPGLSVAALLPFLIDPILIVVGGLIGLAAGSKYQKR